MIEDEFALKAIGVIHSELASREAAPKQGSEGGIDAWLEIHSSYSDGLEGIAVGSDIILITWLHRSSRNKLKVHPRGDKNRPLTGVFSTRSPDRPNPLGLHRVTVREISGNTLRVGPMETIDGTPVVDIKPVLPRSPDS
jgi:tRNA-Thr(GGU) m(6)t(6)A37 methyltransferase TsaA